MPQQERPAGLVVIEPIRDWKCAKCASTGDFLRMDDTAAVHELRRPGSPAVPPGRAHRPHPPGREGTGALRSAQQRVDAIHAHMLHGIAPAETERLAGWLTRIAVTLEESHPGAREA